MGREYKKDNAVWKHEFGVILTCLFKTYDLDYSSFAAQYNWSTSTVRYWLIGRSLPKEGLAHLKEFFQNNIPINDIHDEQIYEELHVFFESHHVEHIFYSLRKLYPTMNFFAGEVLSVCRDYAKNDLSGLHLESKEIPPTGKTRAVVFDFDGTLTSGKTNRTTWESIWTSLDYDVKCCQELHLRFNRNEITHAEWCKLTEQCFRKRNLHRETIDKIASGIRLLKGVKATFQELQKRDVKIYIVSGSILSVIRSVLGSNYQYIDGIKANQFRYDESGLLTEIIGTKYDFEGKASFISEIASELRISPKDILFIGNSVNDQFAYISGAKTLCINPKLTDITNRTIWNDCIPICRDLWEILQYV